MKKLCYFLVFVISSVSSAPAGKDSLFDVVKSDKRTELLWKRPILKECKLQKPISKSICFALYDISLTFNSRNQGFHIKNATFEENSFCQSLKKVLPDVPANNDSAVNFKDVKWLKDVDEEQCKEKCFYEDPNDYERSLVAVCRFLFNQYTFLSEESQKQPGKTDKSEEKKPDNQEAKKPVEVFPAAYNESANKFVMNETSPKVFLDATSNKTVETITNADSAVAKTAPVASEDIKKAENATEVEKKPLAQTSPATTTTLKVTVKASEPTTKVADVNAEIQSPLNEDDDDDENPPNEVFDGSETSDSPDVVKEDDKLESDKTAEEEFSQDYDGEDKEEIDSPVRNNNIAPESPKKLRKQPDDGQTTIEKVNFEENPDSNFFAYLCSVMFLCVFLYILHQNRQKLLALCLEGRRGSRRSSRSRGGSKAAYSKLDCNLEEAITSTKSMSGKSMDIIY